MKPGGRDWLSVAALFLLAFFNSYQSCLSMMRPLNVRIVSYNVLSSHLARIDQYPTLNPDHLVAKNRLPVVLKKLDEEINKKSVICLQEVSYDCESSFWNNFLQS